MDCISLDGKNIALHVKVSGQVSGMNPNLSEYVLGAVQQHRPKGIVVEIGRCSGPYPEKVILAAIIEMMSKTSRATGEEKISPTVFCNIAGRGSTFGLLKSLHDFEPLFAEWFRIGFFKTAERALQDIEAKVRNGLSN
jgi:hypothetical protein